jgi:hypothetical protein
VSIKVDVDALGRAMARSPRPALLISVGPDRRPHVVSVQATLDDGRLRMEAGRTSRSNVTATPDVTLVWPGRDGDDYCLIVDGTARALDEPGASEVALVVEPTSAVLHRVAGVRAGSRSASRSMPTSRNVGRRRRRVADTASTSAGRVTSRRGATPVTSCRAPGP